jgi:hypothetical protein
MMHSRNIVLTAFLSSLITVLLIVAVFFGVGTSLANDAIQEGDPPVSESDNMDSPDVPEDEEAILGTEYLHVAGYAFKPFPSTTTYAVSDNGCAYTTSGSYLFYEINLPVGSTITGLTLYYRDTHSAEDGSLRLHRYNDGLDEYLYTSSIIETEDGCAALACSKSVDLNIFVQPSNYSFALLWFQDVGGSTMQLCGFNLSYTTPGLFGTALPVIKK